MTASIDSFLSEWTAAERGGDTEQLEALLAGDARHLSGPPPFPKPSEPRSSSRLSGEARGSPPSI